MPDQPLILVVDDDPDFREILFTKLTASGFRVETAVNGEEGVSKAKALKPNLILMDVKMPLLDGAGALLKLRENPETKDIKVIFLTSLGGSSGEMQEADKMFAQDFGAQGYVKKSDNLDVLVGRVRAALQ